jgi:hypothetical protein
MPSIVVPANAVALVMLRFKNGVETCGCGWLRRWLWVPAFRGDDSRRHVVRLSHDTAIRLIERRKLTPLRIHTLVCFECAVPSMA